MIRKEGLFEGVSFRLRTGRVSLNPSHEESVQRPGGKKEELIGSAELEESLCVWSLVPRFSEDALGTAGAARWRMDFVWREALKNGAIRWETSSFLAGRYRDRGAKSLGQMTKKCRGRGYWEGLLDSKTSRAGGRNDGGPRV